MPSVEFVFGMHQTVRLKSLDVDGKVIGMAKDNDGTSYKVVYWYNGERRVEWVFIWELL